MLASTFAQAAQSNQAAKSTGTAQAAQSNQAAQTGQPDQPIVTRLPNGLTVLILPDNRFPLVSLRLYVHAGSAYESPREAGISHMLEHMVFKGTDKRPKGQVAVDVERTGGYLNAATSFDYTVYLTDMTTEHWKTGLDVLKDMAFHPSLDAAELESEKEVVVAELKRGEDNPGQRLFRMNQGLALSGTPYAAPIIGFEETIRSFNSDMIRAYIERLYQPGAMLLVVVGDVQADEVLAEAEALFGSLSNREAISPPPAHDASAMARGFKVQVESGPWNKVYLSVSVPVPGLGDSRSAQLDVLAHALGGDASSRLYQTFKYGKRLVDGISASNYSFERLGLFTVRATLDANKLTAFWQAFCEYMAELSNGEFSKEELARARLNIEDDLYRSKETLAGYASKLGYFALFSDGEQGEANYLRAVKNTDSAALTALAAEFLRPEALSLSVLMPEETLPLRPELPGKPDPRPWDEWFKGVQEEMWPGQPGQSEAAPMTGASGAAEIIDLDHGRTLVLLPDRTLPYAAVNLVFNGGDSLLEEKDQGLAAFTASLLTKGAGGLEAPDVERFLSDRAASLNAASGRLTFSVSLDAPTRFLSDMFGLLRDTLSAPAMKEEEAARVRDNQIAAIVASEDQPTGLAFRRLFPFLFSAHPYGYVQLGQKDRVAAFSSEEARAFWARQSSRPWALSVCGSFDRDLVLEMAARLPVPQQEKSSPEAPVWNPEKELELHLPGRNQAHYFMVFPTVGYDNEDEPGLDLLRDILAGQSGLLFRDLRDKQGLGYTVTAFPWKSQKTGALIFYIGTEPDKVAQADEGFRKIAASLRSDLLPEAELERGKNQMNADYYRENQRLGARSAEAAMLTALGRPLGASRDLVDKAGKLEAEHLRDLAAKYLDPARAYIIKVLP